MAGVERFSAGRELAIVFDVTIKEYLKEIDESPLLTLEQEQALGRKIVQENDPEAREHLVRSNLRLVVNIAKKYANRGMNLGDLIEEGNLGLIKAVDYYDPERGTRFSTYAAWWIKQSIKRSLLTNIQPVHIPTYMVALINHWRRMAAELENKLGRPPEIKEMADAMQIPQRKSKIINDIVEILGSIRDTAGGDGADEGQMIEASLPTQGTARPEDSLIEDEEKAKALKMLGQIDPREAEIMKLHYGLDGSKPLTLKEIGEKLNLTRERIRQLQHSALTKLYECMNQD